VSCKVNGEERDRTRILLVDDHCSVRQAIASVFEREPEFAVVGQAGSLSEARQVLDGVDVAVVDLTLPDGYGGKLIRELRYTNPHAVALVLSANLDRMEMARALEHGAAGVLHKSVSMQVLTDAVRRVHAGESLLPLEEVVELFRLASSQRELEHDAHETIRRLTSREKEVLQALAEGLDRQEISKRLHISAGTTRNHITRILAKLGVHSQTQALVCGLRHGVVSIR
jgi:DNA-binding NarL/FixJ family response regulator